MNNPDDRTVRDALILLCACAVSGTVPEKARLEGVSLDRLYGMAQSHMLTAAAGMALEAAGIRDEKFKKAVARAQMKNVLLDADRGRVLARLEEAGIRYMPLKGILLKDLYPKAGMREMADNDIMVDPERREDVRRIMEELGFTVDHYEEGKHDSYLKKPVSNFEMHVRLTGEESNEQTEAYYIRSWDRLLKDPGNRYGYHFSDEDFYLFMIVHEYGHYAWKGTGLRSLLDTFVFLKRKGDGLDWEYIRQEAEKMGLAGFERENREAAMQLFGGERLSESGEEMLDYMLRSGTYGNYQNLVQNRIQNQGRLKYFLSRLTIPKETMRQDYPILNRAPFLYPAVWAWRFIYRFFTRREKFISQLRGILGLDIRAGRRDS